MEPAFTPTLKGEWHDLLQGGEELQFKKGQVLFYEGHSPYGIFVIQAGTVQFKEGETRCAEDHFWTAPSGHQVIGAHHFFSETTFCCTAIAATDCRLVFIPKSQLIPFLKSGPKRASASQN